jgi:hypothetical protein
MPVLSDVLAWTWIAIGVLNSAWWLVMLMTGRARRRFARRAAWRAVRYSLYAIAFGVLVLASGWMDDAARWLLSIAIFVVAFLDYGLWFRARMRCGSGGATA